MKFKSIYLLLFLVLVTSCKSKKKVVTTTKKNKVEVRKKSSKNKKYYNKKRPKSIRLSTLEYIEKYKNIAMHEMKQHKIPASITLAQGVLESGSGNSELTRKSNNHFGIKCHKKWSGHKTYHDDDHQGECFRVYKNASQSFSDHSTFLVTRKRYAKLFRLRQDDYVGWAKGLSRAGYATDRRYAAKLIAIIEKYNLAKYDALVLGKNYKKPSYVKQPKNHIVSKGETLYSISKRYGITVEKLKKLNNLTSTIIGIGDVLIVRR